MRRHHNSQTTTQPGTAELADEETQDVAPEPSQPRRSTRNRKPTEKMQVDGRQRTYTSREVEAEEDISSEESNEIGD